MATSSKKPVELSIEKDPKEEALKSPPRHQYGEDDIFEEHGYEIRLVRINGALIETTCTCLSSTVQGWIKYMRRDHRGRLAPLVAGISVYRGTSTKLYYGCKGPAQSPNHHSNPIHAISICLGGTHCLIFRTEDFDVPEYGPAGNPLRLLLEDRRMKVVGFGIEKMAAKLDAEWGVRVANPVDVTALAGRAFGEEKVFESKPKGKATVNKCLSLEQVAELVLDGMKMPKKPTRLMEAQWLGYHPKITEEQVMYATSDAFLCFQIGKKCFEMTGVPTS